MNNEELLKFKLEVLGKRMSNVAVILEDCVELVRADGKINNDVFHALLTAMLSPEEHGVFVDIEELPEYKAARAAVRTLLHAKLKEVEHARTKHESGS